MRAPVVLYMRHGIAGEQTVKYLPDDVDEYTALQRAYRLAAWMIEHGTAAPRGVRLGDTTYSMADLEERYGPWDEQPLA